MWIFCKDGFFSTVQLVDDPNTLMVRARLKQDMDRLVKVLGIPKRRIRKTPENDYLYRVLVDRADWTVYLAKAGNDVDYPNFKAACAKRAARSECYLKVWRAMLEWQNRNSTKGLY